jgi:hypothetical protein
LKVLLTIFFENASGTVCCGHGFSMPSFFCRSLYCCRIKRKGRRRVLEDTERLNLKADILRELSDDWRRNAAILNAAVKGREAILEDIKRLCKGNNQGNLMKIGLTLIAFPLPIVIDDVLGWSFLAAGLIQKRIKNSALYLEDIDKSLPSVLRELQDLRQEIV